MTEARYAVVRFHKPVPARVMDEYDPNKKNAAIFPGALAGVVSRERGAVYPFPTVEDARTVLDEFEASGDPSEIPYRWEPHYSSEYVELEEAGA